MLVLLLLVIALERWADNREITVVLVIRVVVGVVLKEDLVVGVVHEDSHIIFLSWWWDYIIYENMYFYMFIYFYKMIRFEMSWFDMLYDWVVEDIWDDVIFSFILADRYMMICFLMIIYSSLCNDGFIYWMMFEYFDPIIIKVI